MLNKFLESANLKIKSSGKVRNLYELGEYLLIVATDRISAFDIIMSDSIPDKGKILTQLSLYWFEVFKDIIPNHLVTSNLDDYPVQLKPFYDQLDKCSMIVKKCEPIPIEAIVRGYLTGSSWLDYKKTGKVCGYNLPSGLHKFFRFDEPIFTPSTKSKFGSHDFNITIFQAEEIVGKDILQRIANYSINIYKYAHEIAIKKGIIIADTKLEFGKIGDQIFLIDEILTPDSSRFWYKDDYYSFITSGILKSFDKQILRDWLESVNFDKQSPAPKLPVWLISDIRARYLEALIRITGRGL